MSIKYMRGCWEQELPSTVKFLLICLADFADDYGRAWPSLSLVANRCGVGDSTARKHLKTLAECGFVQICPRYGSSDLYVLSPNLLSFESESAQIHPPYKEEPPENHQGTINACDLRFDEFWAIYPRRESKAFAKKSWIRAVSQGVDPAEVISGAKRYAEFRRGQDARFTKMPATWINQECWTDELATSSRGPNAHTADHTDSAWAESTF